MLNSRLNDPNESSIIMSKSKHYNAFKLLSKKLDLRTSIRNFLLVLLAFLITVSVTNVICFYKSHTTNLFILIIISIL